ncbi:MAG: NlpC/P60 family protein [Bacteroidales bacterium]|nr:NlpC/P60 family protein [Bacteroidales bacterium]
MKKLQRLSLFFIMLIAIGSLSSCKALKQFLSTDLEDEDFIIGQLYADEYYDEPAFKPQTPPAGSTQPTHRNNTNGGTGIILNDKDNEKLYAVIDRWFGTPYLYGGCSTSGIDCSCFVDKVFSEVYGITLHRTASDIQKDVTLISRNQLREGDIVFFTNSNGKVSHVGIYLKDDLFAHSSTSRGVTVSQLSNTYWNAHFYKGGRHKKVTTKY